MKKIYWRPKAVSRTALALIAIVSLAGLLMVEWLKAPRQQPYYEEKRQATELAAKAMQTIKDIRQQRGPAIDELNDPTKSGLVGLPMSEVTSVTGVLAAKQTSINPNFAAAMVDMLKEAGVKEGDVVGVGVSGSFPALNICTYAALETLGCKPVVIASASASKWGANVPGLIWIDMEKELADAKVFTTRSVAASLGGDDDRGLGLSPEGIRLVTEAIERNQIPLLEVDTSKVTPEADEFQLNVARRIEIYRNEAGGRKIAAYVNVGGGAVSNGRAIGKRIFHPGLNLRLPARAIAIDGVMPELMAQGVPVIHLVEVVTLAEKYGLPVSPTQFPQVGEGAVFTAIDYNPPLVVGVLATILLCLYGFIRSDVGFRLLNSGAGKSKDTRPEPMV